jgi:DNA replication protein DnaC
MNENTVRTGYWLKWLEEQGLGDAWKNLSGKIEQSKVVVAALHSFAIRPSKVMIMCGKPGTGKTYCALKIAAYYLQWRSDALFFTSASLKEKWLQAQRDDSLGHFMHRLREYGLLIIDDFGQKEPTPGFMEMLFDLLNSRLQWSDRGTVLTSNMSPEALLMSVGEAMSDRLRGQQWLLFNGESKRS